MVWLAHSQEPGTVGNTGDLYWWRPDAAIASDFTLVPRPSGINAMDSRASWDKYEDFFLGVGGWTENMVFTQDFGWWQQGMRPPVLVPDVTLAGTGLTGNVIFYESWLDSKTNERSALGAGTATQAAVNQGISWNAATGVPPARATHKELWVSLDGSLPRLLIQVQIGAGTITKSPAVADFGEAFTEDFELFPRCRFNVVWHDRQVMAGDDQNPRTLYLSLIGFPERASSLSLDTKSRQNIVGLTVVNEQLLVLCAFATERVQGWTEDDLSIEIAKPTIGCLSHFGVVKVSTTAWIPTAKGYFLTDGTGWFDMMRDVSQKWVSEVKLRPAAYEAMWAYHDPVSDVVKAYVGTHSDTPGKTFWVADYTVVLPDFGGDMGQPNWSYDVSTRSYDCAGVLAVPGGKRSDTFLGSCDGSVYEENSGNVGDDADDAGDTLGKQLVLRTGADAFLDVGGDLAHGKTWTEDDAFVKAENNEWEYHIYAGDEYAFPALAPSFDSGTIPASAGTGVDPDSGNTYHLQPKTVWHFEPLPGVIGRRRITEIIGINPSGMEFYGYATDWKEGDVVRGLTDVQVE